MRFSLSLPSASIVALAAYTLTYAAPLKRTVSSTDVLVLQFAHVLEQFECAFYTQALSQFQEQDFITAGFSVAEVAVQQFQSIQFDESTHVSILESTITSLGATPISNCQFNFNSALSDVSTMTATARVVEDLGVAAYLGAAHLISDPILLTAAASIVTVEARHQTLLNILEQGTAIPQAFDIPFTPSEVLAVAGQFITGCDLGISAFSALSVTNTETVTIGTTLSFSSSAITGDTSNLFCQMIVGGAPNAIVLPFNACVVPQVNGPVALWITSDNQSLINNPRDRATDKLVAGPTMVFIDPSADVLGQLARSGSPTVSGNSSVQTITPSQASAVVASASAAASAPAGPSALTVDGFSPVKN